MGQLSVLGQLLTVALVITGSACGGGTTGPGPHTPPPLTAAAQSKPYRGGYRLPVEGRWRVYRTHYDANNDQSTAVDLVVDAPLPPRATHPRNKDFPSYGQTIVADAPGVIVTVVDGVPDNPPTIQNGYDAHGNYVVIDHRNGEYSLFAHFVPGSITVRVGQWVGMGQRLGACGNSGRSTMPHLHWQVMDHPQAHRARGVPIRLLRYQNNGRPSQARLDRGRRVQAISVE